MTFKTFCAVLHSMPVIVLYTLR